MACTIDALESLYAQIPKFTCKPGCTDCCGPVPFSRAEWSRVNDQRVATCIDCPYSMNGGCDIYDHRPFICRLFGGCDIYDHRPFICRLFGAVDDERLKCPHGCAPMIPLTKEEGQRLTYQYKLLEHLA